MNIATLSTYLLQTSIAVSVLIALVLLIRRPFAEAFGAKAAYALWALPVLRLVLPPLPLGWSLFTPLGTGATPASAPPAPAIADHTVHLPISEISFLAADPLAPTITGLRTEAAEPVSLMAIMADLVGQAAPWLLGIWAAGALVVLLTGFVRQKRAADLIEVEGRNAGPVLQTNALDVRRAIGLDRKDIAIKKSLISSGPLVTGLFRKTVLLPEWFEEDYSREEQRIALMHEMMHIKRGDLWALQIAAIATALQWFNPLAWMALRAFRTDQEAACDADVLGVGETSAHSYGSTLVKAVRISRPVAQPVHAASLPLNHALHERLSQMKNPLPNRQKKRLATLLTASVGATALIMSACASSNAQTAELDGGPDTEVRVEKRAVFISDGDSDADSRVVIIESGDLDPETRLKISKLEDLESLEGLEVELAKLEALEDLESLEGLESLAALESLKVLEDIQIVTRINGDHEGGATALFFSDGDETSWTDEDGKHRVIVRSTHHSGPEGVEEFERELRRLAEDPEANEAEIEALTEAFEAKMEAWAEKFEAQMEAKAEAYEHAAEARARVKVLRLGDGEHFSWSGDGASIDVDDIMTELRESGELSEERLEEVEASLEEAREKLEDMDFDFDFDFDFEIDADEDE